MTTPTVTQISICNSALLKCGGDVIASIDESSRAALVCRTLFQYLADEVMGSSPWRFATKRTVLTPNTNTPPFGYTYAYDIPSDCLRPLESDGNSASWTVEDGSAWNPPVDGPQILSNDSSVQFKYLYRNTDPSSWDARFAETLAWRLAMELALSVTRSIPFKQEAEKSYNAALAQARAMNATVGTIPPLIADVWTKARRGYRFFRPTEGQEGNDPLLNS